MAKRKSHWIVVPWRWADSHEWFVQDRNAGDPRFTMASCTNRADARRLAKAFNEGHVRPPRSPADRHDAIARFLRSQLRRLRAGSR